MGGLAWIMTGLAIWHFTVFIPDRFWGGIVGAFLGAVFGAFIFGFLVSGLTVPGRNDTDIVDALISVPGAILGIGAMYLLGARRGNAVVHF